MVEERKRNALIFSKKGWVLGKLQGGNVGPGGGIAS